jgi:uncharacterized membrane protein
MRKDELMRLQARWWVERVRGSLFFVPLVGVLAAIALALLGLGVDSQLDEEPDLPLGLASTVESARTLLSTVASATITFAAIAFSVSLLVIQQASNQFSPRIVQTLFRDPFNKRVMALVVGTFTYCLIVLRSVRSPLEPGGDPVIPNLSVAVAVLLGIATILAVVAFINHSAHSMDISQILERARHEAVTRIGPEWSTADPDRPAPERVAPPIASTCVVRFDRSGWVQQIDEHALLGCVPADATMHLRTSPGRYAVAGTAMCALSMTPADLEEREPAIRDAVSIGDTRTLQQDPVYGVRELVDVTLRALSPGVNDPTTAQDAIFHTTAVLAELLVRDPPPITRRADDGRCLVLAERPTHQDLVRLAFDEPRRAAADQPSVCIYLLEALALLHEIVAAAGLSDRQDALIEQAQLVVAGCDAADHLPADRLLVRAAYDKRFRPS